MEFDEELMIPDKSLSINEGAITVLGWQSCNDKKSYTNAMLKALCKEFDFDLDTPFEDYPQHIQMSMSVKDDSSALQSPRSRTLVPPVVSRPSMPNRLTP